MFYPAALIRQGRNGQPVNQVDSGLCACGCHGHEMRPLAVEARLCQECADERFQSWRALVDVLMRDD